MKISVIGSGCPKCKALYNRLKKLKVEGRICAEIEYIADINELAKKGIMGSPALLMDNRLVHVGIFKSDEKLLEIIERHSGKDVI